MPPCFARKTRQCVCDSRRTRLQLKPTEQFFGSSTRYKAQTGTAQLVSRSQHHCASTCVNKRKLTSVPDLAQATPQILRAPTCAAISLTAHATHVSLQPHKCTRVLLLNVHNELHSAVHFARVCECAAPPWDGSGSRSNMLSPPPPPTAQRSGSIPRKLPGIAYCEAKTAWEHDGRHMLG